MLETRFFISLLTISYLLILTPSLAMSVVLSQKLINQIL